MFYLPLTPASKPQTDTNTRVRETRSKRQWTEKRRAREIAHTRRYVVFLNFHFVSVSFRRFKKTNTFSRAPLLSFVLTSHFSTYHGAQPQTHRYTGVEIVAPLEYNIHNVVCARATRARAPSGAIITMHVIVGYRIPRTRYSYLAVLSVRIDVTVESQGISAVKK